MKVRKDPIDNLTIRPLILTSGVNKPYKTAKSSTSYLFSTRGDNTFSGKRRRKFPGGEY
ncbi:hypothetical protein UWK_00389 [Desulfocapsa sulfexigens DSM 10523]|uniref:Uncharacterized protein n=1 Tax=Desulfocapsa sulfexigens (strain DSM 10523 / SB164P1) TaxID=1167006 RepID=M1NB06_DESSD|nr:hypothetical protein UWK_00389 [Desulfocapsa sulfexigens DSM 10523]